MKDTRRLHALLDKHGVPWRTTMQGRTEWSIDDVTFDAVVNEGSGELILTAYPVTIESVDTLMKLMSEGSRK